MKICPKCAAENADTAKFCNECGTALEIKKTETPETVNDPEPVSETSKENISTVENVESTPVAIAETVRDGLESTTEQIEKKEEPSPKKKNHLIIGIVAVALVCIIGFIATRPRLKSLEVTYSGDLAEGVILDNHNEGFKVTAVYSNGKEEDVPAGEWQITEPQTLVADNISDVTITYKDIKEEINIECSTTVLQYLTATYNGSTYEGTEVNRNSDITVTGHYKKEGVTQEFTEGWYLDPETVTLKAGETSKVTVKINGSDGNTYSADIEITGTEKPFTNPKIEGDHYNFSAKQLVAYLESDLGYGFSKDRQTKIGDSYFYRVETINNKEIQPFHLEIRENANAKVNYVAFTSDDIMEGLDTSIILARAFGGTMKSVEKNDMTVQMFMISKMHVSDDTLIECIEHSDGEGYSFYVMPDDYSEAFWKELYNK